jgi:hypothetical protein
MKDYIEWSGVSEKRADGNARAIMALLEESVKSKKILKPPAVEIPLDAPIFLPPHGNFIWDCPSGFKLRPQFSNPRGFVTQADLSKSISGITISGLVIEPEINTATGNPHEGNGFFLNLSASRLPGLRVENYWNDQAFLIALYDCKEVSDWYFYTEQVKAGTGGIRLVGGKDTDLTNVSGQSGDDCIQFVPGNTPEGNLFNLSIERCRYIGGNVTSTLARSLAVITDTYVSSSIINCGFYNINGKASIRGVIVTGRNGLVSGITIENCNLDLSNDDGRFEAVLIDGRVENSNINLHVEHFPGRLLTINSYTSSITSLTYTPTNNSLNIQTQNQPTRDKTKPLIHLKNGVNNRLKTHLIAPQTAPAILVSGGEGFTIENSSILDVAKEQVGIRFVGGAHHKAIKNTFNGQGAAISWLPESSSTGYEAENELGGMRSVKVRPKKDVT